MQRLAASTNPANAGFFYIPLRGMYQLENPGLFPLEMIEVQSGSYWGEDDIVCFDDSYGRK